MPRKKISTDEKDAAVIAELDADEEFVVDTTTTKRVRRERREKPSETVETTDAIDAEPILDAEPDDILEIPPLPYSPTSLAAMIYDETDEPNYAEEFCTVAVRRQPDTMGDSFATPCTAVTNLPRVQNVEITADKADVEDRVRREYGGGHYFFQIRLGSGLSRSWKATLADLPRVSATTEATTQPTTTVHAAPPSDPFDSFLDNLRRQRELRALLFGDEEKRLHEELRQLREQVQNARALPAEPQSDLALAVSLLKDAHDPTIVDFIRDAVMPSPEPESKTGFWDFAKYLFDNKNEIIGLLGPVLGSFAPGTPPGTVSPNAALAAALKAPPPTLPTTDIEPRGQSRFSRKKATSKTEENNDDNRTNDTSLA